MEKHGDARVRVGPRRVRGGRHRVLLRNRQIAEQRHPERQVDPLGQTRGDEVRLQERPVLLHERRRVVAPAPPRRDAQITQTDGAVGAFRVAIRRGKHTRVVVELRNGFVRGPGVEALDRTGVLVRHETPAHAFAKLRNRHDARQIHARRRLAQELVRDVVRRRRVRVGEIELRVPFR